MSGKFTIFKFKSCCIRVTPFKCRFEIEINLLTLLRLTLIHNTYYGKYKLSSTTSCSKQRSPDTTTRMNRVWKQSLFYTIRTRCMSHICFPYKPHSTQKKQSDCSSNFLIIRSTFSVKKTMCNIRNLISNSYPNVEQYMKHFQITF